jgi:hypothetical protein
MENNAESPFYSTGRNDPISGLVELYTKKDSKTSSATDYFHYDCFHETDIGWGCAYRVLQSILSCINRKIDKNYNHSSVPSLYQIQLNLVKIQLFQDKDIGSNKWLEPPDIAQYLEKCHGIKSDEGVFYNPLNKPNNKPETTILYQDFKVLEEKIENHFSTYSTPIMYDDSIYAYSLVGIRKNEKNESEVLRFDPHNTIYEPFENYQKKLVNPRGGVKWMRIEQAFSSSRYMLAFPEFSN